MKMHGKKLQGPNVEIVVLPRSEGDLVFRAEAVLDQKPFFSLCPLPQPPEKILPGGRRQKDVEDVRYNAQLNDWAVKKKDWLLIQSLRNTPGLEWETIRYEDPGTWKNWTTELEESGFSEAEIGRILQAVMSANSLSESKVEEARQRFLAGKGTEQNGRSSQQGEQLNMPSGEPAKDLESSHQE